MAKIRRKKQHPSQAVHYPPGSIGAYAQEYCGWLEARNYSSQTIRGRRHYLVFFVQWCAERGLEAPSEVTKPVIEQYQKLLFNYRKKGGEPLTFRSQHSQLLPLRAFFKWLARQNYILYNPASDIDLPRLDKPLPRNTLSAAEVETVLATIDPREPTGIRDRTIIETLYSTGIRRKELINLQRYDIYFERGTVFIREGKGGKDRVVPIGERAIAWVRKYMYEVRPQYSTMPDSGVLFLNDHGEKYSADRMTEHVRELVDKAEMVKKGSCHMFRHTCATLMLDGGADIRFIQQQLGHADLKTTETYTRVTISKLKAIHTATHPAAKLEPKDRPESGKEKTEEHGEKPGDTPSVKPPAETIPTA
jgi:integrase/recombinase XerD